MSNEYPNGVKTERVGLSDFEAAKQERRVLTAIRKGANKTTLLKMNLTEKRINEIVTKYGVAIPRGQGGKRL